ncbi:MAG: CPBP family glutamic-type intramembrane protease [Actinomycetota bacterium]|nr:CPBP family glutamic-type intramembrane protease [Actinomycetota bacterium]
MAGGSVSPTVAIGLVLAAAAWGAMFGLGRSAFWARAAVAGLSIGAYALVAQRSRLGGLLRPTLPDMALGVAGAVVLYGVFWAGAAILRRWLPAIAAQVDELYTLRSVPTSEPLPIPLVLLLVGPCEELFWRGLVQARAGFVVALACYAAVHLWERKAVLVLAAVAGGAFWGAVFAWRGTLVAPIVSHALWDLAVVVWFPFTGAKATDEGP